MRKYEKIELSDEAVGFIEHRIKQEPSNTQIASEVVKFFGLGSERQDSLRRSISNKRKGMTSTIKPNFKRLFFDIETSPCLGWFWRPSYKTNINPNQVIEYAKIICISYKWAGEDKVYNLHWDEDQNDKEMLSEFMKVMSKADESIAHNGDRFDEKWLRTRCVYHRINAMPKYKTLDTLKKAKSCFLFPSNRLDEIGKYLGVGRKIETTPNLWEEVWQKNNREALKKMVEYCDQDVILLEDVFDVMNSYIVGNSNANSKVSLSAKWKCPECYSEDVELIKVYTSAMGTIQRWMECKCCNKNYKVSAKSYQNYWTSKVNN